MKKKDPLQLQIHFSYQAKPVTQRKTLELRKADWLKIFKAIREDTIYNFQIKKTLEGNIQQKNELLAGIRETLEDKKIDLKIINPAEYFRDADILFACKPQSRLASIKSSDLSDIPENEKAKKLLDALNSHLIQDGISQYRAASITIEADNKSKTIQGSILGLKTTRDQGGLLEISFLSDDLEQYDLLIDPRYRPRRKLEMLIENSDHQLMLKFLDTGEPKQTIEINFLD